MPRGDEQRKHIRVMQNILCWFSSENPVVEDGEGRVLDLSVAGATIESLEPLRVGQALKMQIDIPNGMKCDVEALVIRGQVTTPKPGRGPEETPRVYGVRFTKVNLLDRTRLGDYVFRQILEHNYKLRKLLEKMAEAPEPEPPEKPGKKGA